MRPEFDETLTAPGASDPAATAATGAGRAAGSSGDALPIGIQLGHFRIERKLGAGGMGEVYLATDLALDRPVAIKVLPGGTASGTARERMIREARAQARVHHPNVAHIYYIGEDAGRLYFAMEYLAGTTLAERVATRPMSVEDALAAIRGAALGLREAQRLGFTHRDVKPSNLMMDPHGTVKVLDFGLVAAAPRAAPDGPVEQTTLAGTPLYMAPEQARGEPIDFRTDIYALGATLYHLVTGKPPYQADSADQLATLHAQAARPALPRGKTFRRPLALSQITAIDALIARMMAARPEDRFGSYDELLRAIELASTQQIRPAGVWVRSIATTLDVLAIGMMVAIAFKIAGAQTVVADVVFPIAALYEIAAVGRWGTTLGKALFELEVVDVAAGRRPSWGAAVRRALVLGALPILGGALHAAQALWGIGPSFLPGLVGVGGILLLGLLLVHASFRVPGKRTPWDRLSGTMVRYRTAPPPAG